MNILQELRRLVTNAAAVLKGTMGTPPALAPAAEAVILDFGRLEGQPPAGKVPPLAGGGTPGGWVVRTDPGEAGHMVDVVKRACGPAAQQLLHLLRPLLDTLANGTIPVRLCL